MSNQVDPERYEQGGLICAYHRYVVGSGGWCLHPTEETYTVQGRSPQLHLWLGPYKTCEEACGVLVEITRLPQAYSVETRTEEGSE